MSDSYMSGIDHCLHVLSLTLEVSRAKSKSVEKKIMGTILENEVTMCSPEIILKVMFNNRANCSYKICSRS